MMTVLYLLIFAAAAGVLFKSVWAGLFVAVIGLVYLSIRDELT